MPVAILDFGTNTFNLLIAERDGNSFKRLYNGKQAVKLGRGGIHKGMLTNDAMERGYTAIANHLDTVASYQATEIHAYATSAIRNASNGGEFVSEVKRRFKVDVNVISGGKEAELIYRGITESVDFSDERALILDIGGGSNEFIICDSEKMYWKHSFELGMARIVERFTISDPITPQEITEIEAYYKAELQLLFEKVTEFNPTTLIGASGSFDTIAAILKHRLRQTVVATSSIEITSEQYTEIHRLLVGSTLKEREVMPGMEPVRIEMIVPATIFINFVINSCKLTTLYQSDYALKEGVMAILAES
jgi:exopolyphosphatase / guanosine-5'-triphosphate,3'-diphosphate pyrophosphatase